MTTRQSRLHAEGATVHNTQGVQMSVEHDKCAEEHEVVGGPLAHGQPAGWRAGDGLEHWGEVWERRERGIGGAVVWTHKRCDWFGFRLVMIDAAMVVGVMFFFAFVMRIVRVGSIRA